MANTNTRTVEQSPLRRLATHGAAVPPAARRTRANILHAGVVLAVVLLGTVLFLQARRAAAEPLRTGEEVGTLDPAPIVETADEEASAALEVLSRAYRRSDDRIDGGDPAALNDAARYAAALRTAGRRTEAASILERVLAAWDARVPVDHPDAERTALTLAYVHMELRRWAHARPLLERVLAVRRARLPADDPAIAGILYALGEVDRSAGDIASALDWHQQALDARRKTLGAAHADTLSSQSAVAQLRDAAGSAGDPLPEYERLLEARRGLLGPEHPDTLSTLNDVAVEQQRRGRYEDAARAFETILEVRTRTLGADHLQTLSALNNLGHTRYLLGRVQEALPLLVRCASARERTLGPDDPATLNTLNVLGLALTATGDLEQARLQLSRALAGRRRVLGGDNPATLTTQFNLAIVLRRLGALDEAGTLLDGVVAKRTKVLGAEAPATLVAQGELSMVLAVRGDLDAASAMAARTLALQRDTLGERHAQTLESMRVLASILRAQGKDSEAIELQERTLLLQTATLGASHPSTLLTMNNLATHLHAQGRFDEARPMLDLLVRTAEEALGFDHPATIDYHQNQLQLALGEGRVRTALGLLRVLEARVRSRTEYDAQFVESRQRLDRMQGQGRADVLNIALNMAIENPDIATRYAIELLARSKYLGLEIEAIVARTSRTATDAETEAIAQRVIGYRSIISSAMHDPARISAATLQRALQDLDRDEGELARRSRALEGARTRASHATVDAIAASLPANGMFIDFRRYRPLRAYRDARDNDRYAAAVVSADGSIVRVVDIGAVADTRQDIEDMIDLREMDDDRLLPVARNLYARLFGPLETLLAGRQHVFIAPDGALHSVPFKALVLPDGRRWLQRQSIHQVQTARDLLDRAPLRPLGRLFIVGGVDYERLPPTSLLDAGTQRLMDVFREKDIAPEGRHYTYLQHSLGEAHALDALWRGRGLPTTTLIGVDATESALRDMPETPSHLHLATHGFFRPGDDDGRFPLAASGIVLAGANLPADRKAADDGLLYASEMLSLPLEGTHLVVISACESARAVEHAWDGSIGLVRALRATGARNVISTLWPIGDEYAQEFMAEFYGTLLDGDRTDIAGALQRVQARWATLPGEDPRARPENWAPYVLAERR